MDTWYMSIMSVVSATDCQTMGQRSSRVVVVVVL